MTDSKQPKYRDSIGSIKTAVFEKTVEKNGQTIVQKSISLQKSYKDSSGDWVNNEIWLFPGELSAAIRVLQKAYDNCCLKEETPDG
jgi:hypothetical protein